MIIDLQCPVCRLLEVTLIEDTGEFACPKCYSAGLASHLVPYKVFAIRNTGGILSKLTARRRMLAARKGKDPAPQLYPLIT
jgi:hypothetical protein